MYSSARAELGLVNCIYGGESIRLQNSPDKYKNNPCYRVIKEEVAPPITWAAHLLDFLFTYSRKCSKGLRIPHVSDI